MLYIKTLSIAYPLRFPLLRSVLALSIKIVQSTLHKSYFKNKLICIYYIMQLGICSKRHKALTLIITFIITLKSKVTLHLNEFISILEQAYYYTY